MMTGHHWFRKWLGVRSAPSHYPEQYHSSETIGLRPKDISLLNKTRQTFIKYNLFENKKEYKYYIECVWAIIWTNDG